MGYMGQSMPRRSLSLEVTVVEPGPRTLARLEGPIDEDHAPALQRWIEPLCIPSQQLVLDLRRADLLDSAGVRALLLLQERLEEGGGHLCLLVTPESAIHRTLSLL